MVLRNHIAYRFLTDSNLWMEMVESQYPNIYEEAADDLEKIPEGAKSLYSCVNDTKNKPYIVANSVIEHLDMLKISRKDDHFNWSVFKDLPHQKVTFIFQDNTLLRMVVADNVIWFCHLKFKFEAGSNNYGNMNWVMFYFDRETGALCEHFNSPDVIKMEETIYKFLCFFYLTENKEEIIAPGKVHGTRKTGKISNDLPFPITLVNSKWNTTVIRTESFGVRGHFRVQPCGKGRSNYEIIFIQPFAKTGYRRAAGKVAN
jgi:hypothetical protein